MSSPGDALGREAAIDLTRPHRAHLIGAGGAGMKALAEFLHDAGWSLAGSDESTLPAALVERGLRLHAGHRAEQVAADTELVIHSPAVPADNPERAAAAQRGLPVVSYSRFLGLLSESRETVCVAGTHGKSTTSALTAHLLEAAGLRPGAVIGAESLNRGASGWPGDGSLLVLESCEYQRHFLELTPRHAAITGIEPDHFDCYPELQDAQDAYRAFVGRIAPGGTLVLPAGLETTLAIPDRADRNVVTFAVDGEADWSARQIEVSPRGTSFDLEQNSRSLGRQTLHIPGRHNVANALAAIALTAAAGGRPEAFLAGLETFRGIGRRFQILAESAERVLIGDYAHHPTAVSQTLRTARELYPGRRLWCVFQPHQVSRTRMLLEEFAASLQGADQVLLPPVFTARESDPAAGRAWSDRLARLVADGGAAAQAVASLDRVVSTLEHEARSGDVIIIMGAGDIDRIHHELIGRLF